MSDAAKLLAVPEEFIRRLADTPIANHRATEDLARIQIDAIRLLNECRYVNGEQRRRSDCAWTQDSDGLYNTGCGHVWFFDSGTAAENEAKFCVYCGGNLKANEYVEEPDDSSPPISRGSERG